MQERKQLERAIEQAREVAGRTEDLDTLFELAREGEDVTGDIGGELTGFAERLESYNFV